MTVQLSLTGVTILSQTRYKQRHSGCNDVYQTPDRGMITKHEFKRLEKLRLSNHKRPSHKVKNQRKTGSNVKIPRSYTINKKEVVHRIRNYVNMMKGEKQLYFWTVSFPKGTKDNVGMILLNKWLTRLRTEKMIKEYLWISERQDNGTIHFHMVINRKMCVQKANKFMRASIMHCINNNEIEYNRVQAKNYNGVDIAKNRKSRRVINFAKEKNQKSLSNYLTKYCTKNNHSFQQLAWHNSREYSNLVIAIRFTAKEWISCYQKDLVNKENPIIHEYYSFYRWKGKPPNELLTYLADINNHISELLTKN
jgi:hypothetical protein